MKYLLYILFFFCFISPASAYDGEPWEMTASGTATIYFDAIDPTVGWTRSTLEVVKGTYPSG